jgi:hypothetical protein
VRESSLVLLCLLIGCGTQERGNSPATSSRSGYTDHGWWFSQDTVHSEMDDVTRVINPTVDLMGELVLSPDSSGLATLRATCEDRTLSFMVNLGDERDAQDVVRMRVDSALPEHALFFDTSGRLGRSVPGLALIKGAQARALLKRLENATWLRFEFRQPYRSVPRTVRFKVAGLSDVVQPLYAACPA